MCESDLAPRLSAEQDLMLSVVECVGHDDAAVARHSIQFLVRLGNSSTGLEALYSPTVLQALSTVMLTSDTVRFRVYEVRIKNLIYAALIRIISLAILISFIYDL